MNPARRSRFRLTTAVAAALSGVLGVGLAAGPSSAAPLRAQSATTLGAPAGSAAPADLSSAVIDTTMKRVPDPAKLGGWGYQVGLFLYGTDLVYQRTHNAKYLNYIRGWVDHFVSSSGHISNGFGSLDSMQAGNLLILLNQQTGQAKYATAAAQIRQRLNTYPRTPDGGFWHATSKTNQLWLDGTYMIVPFLLRYGAAYNDAAYADAEAAKQITVYGSHLQSPTGLLYHAYSLDPISWADPSTHHSAQFWCRSIGWYGMASLATLDALPATDPHRATILSTVQNLVSAIGRYQDPATGRWFQIVDKGSLSANWTETSCSAMFTFIVAKSVALGYVPAADQSIAAKGYQGVLAEVSTDSSGATHIKNICIGTNVGDLSYYLGRPRATDDFHGLGAFLIMNEWMQGNRAG
jgi:unsaturated rhamnogalacturonyl hydrolase